MDATSYPLSWPRGWKRTQTGQHKVGRFTDHGRTITVSRALDRLEAELARLGVPEWNVIVSTNLRLGMRGSPISSQPEPLDRGVAVYFKLNDKDRVLACDRYTIVADNIAAIAAHIDCLRGIDRYGVGTLDQAFAGYDALPPPSADNRAPWRLVMGFEGSQPLTLEEVEQRFRQRARTCHPDVPGGSHESMAALNAAIEQAREELGT